MRVLFFGATRARSSRNRPLERPSTITGLSQGWAGQSPTDHAGRNSLRIERPLRTLTRRAGSRSGRITHVIFHAVVSSFNDDRLPVMHQPVDQGRGQGVVHIDIGRAIARRADSQSARSIRLRDGRRHLGTTNRLHACRWADSPAHRGGE